MNVSLIKGTTKAQENQEIGSLQNRTEIFSLAALLSRIIIMNFMARNFFFCSCIFLSNKIKFLIVRLNWNKKWKRNLCECIRIGNFRSTSFSYNKNSSLCVFCKKKKKGRKKTTKRRKRKDLWWQIWLFKKKDTRERFLTLKWEAFESKIFCDWKDFVRFSKNL